MFSRKDKKIAMLEARIKNRNNLIENQDVKAIRQNNKINQLEQLNKKMLESLQHIENSISNYERNRSNPYTLIRKIKEELNSMREYDIEQ